MGALRGVKPVNLICGLISSDPDLMKRALRLLSQQAGPADEVSELWPFDYTDYYLVEMGENLQRQFVSFEPLIDPAQLAYLKQLTNDLERRICHDLGLPTERRLVNLDPGYLTLGKIVLATTKDYSHRIYLRDGIYAESTLRYLEGHWTAWPWTYPDYAGPRYHAFFDRVRTAYGRKLAQREQDPTRGAGADPL